MKTAPAGKNRAHPDDPAVYHEFGLAVGEDDGEYLTGVLGPRAALVSRRAPMQLISTTQTSLTGLQLISRTAQRTG